jgi:uncharacterized phiE125 gp8 family phage protein
MTITIITPPVSEPVSLAEAKAFLRLETSDEDDLVSHLISTAREAIERSLGLALITQTVRETLDAFTGSGVQNHGRAYRLAVQPLVSVTAVAVRDASGGSTPWDADQYFVMPGLHGCLVLTPDGRFPASTLGAGGIEVTYVAGFGAAGAQVPNAIRQAILLAVADGFENRTGITDYGLSPVISALIAPYRRVRL